MKRMPATLICVAICLSSCGGPLRVGGGADLKAMRKMVPESFHATIKNPQAVRYLASIDPKRLPEESRVEILTLKGLSQASSEDELCPLFDRLWAEHDEIRFLVNHPKRGKSSPYLLAILYYLLSTGPAGSWQEESADRLYREALPDLTPTQLSGYALHFYTFALLKNYRFESVDPFLRRLEHFTSRRDYLRDLTFALNCAVAAEDDQYAGRLMAIICRTWEKSSEPFPEAVMKDAAVALRKAEKIEAAKEAVFPLIKRNPSLMKYAFVDVLRGEAVMQGPDEKRQ